MGVVGISLFAPCLAMFAPALSHDLSPSSQQRPIDLRLRVGKESQLPYPFGEKKR